MDGLGLTAFVGEKIFLKEVPPPPNTRVFDSHYRARYKIRQLICGDEVGSEIEFDVYDHYGSPKFAECYATSNQTACRP